MREWYAVRTKSRVEERVAARLEERGFETLLPLVVNQQGAGPLFPTYLFLHIDLETAHPGSWQRVPGLHYLVGYGGEPVAIPGHAIRMIAQEMAGPHGRPAQPSLRFQPGDRVRIKEGPFAELSGIFDAYLSSEERVRILLETMQRSIRVQVQPELLEKVSDDDVSQDLSDEKARAKKKRPRRTRGRGRPIRRS